MAEFSPFVQQAQQYAGPRSMVDQSFLIPGRQAHKRVSPILKMKQGLRLLLTLSFHRRGNPKRKKKKLCNSFIRSKSFE